MTKGTRVLLKFVDAESRAVGEPIHGTVVEPRDNMWEIAFDDGTKGVFGEDMEEVDGTQVSVVIGLCAEDVLENTGLLVDDAVNEYAGALLVVMD